MLIPARRLQRLGSQDWKSDWDTASFIVVALQERVAAVMPGFYFCVHTFCSHSTKRAVLLVSTIVKSSF